MASVTDTIAGLLGGAGQAASVILPYTMSEDAISSVKQMGTELGARAPLVGAEAAGMAEFQPFTVTTGTAQTAIGPEGGYTQTLAPTGQQIQEGMFTQALGAIPQTQVTPEQLYSQLQTMRTPDIQRQRQALEQRLAAQGRLGTSSMMYGGATPEQLALEQSLREQESKDMLAALTQAGALTGQNITNIAGMLGVGYTPETQALAQLTPAAQFGQIAQQFGQVAGIAVKQEAMLDYVAEKMGVPQKLLNTPQERQMVMEQMQQQMMAAQQQQAAMQGAAPPTEEM